VTPRLLEVLEEKDITRLFQSLVLKKSCEGPVYKMAAAELANLEWLSELGGGSCPLKGLESTSAQMMQMPTMPILRTLNGPVTDQSSHDVAEQLRRIQIRSNDQILQEEKKTSFCNRYCKTPDDGSLPPGSPWYWTPRIEKWGERAKCVKTRMDAELKQEKEDFFAILRRHGEHTTQSYAVEEYNEVMKEAESRHGTSEMLALKRAEQARLAKLEPKTKTKNPKATCQHHQQLPQKRQRPTKKRKTALAGPDDTSDEEKEESEEEELEEEESDEGYGSDTFYEFEVGDTVRVFWKKYQKWFQGEVTKVMRKTYEIKYACDNSHASHKKDEPIFRASLSKLYC